MADKRPRQARERGVAAEELVAAGAREHRLDARRRNGAGDEERVDGVDGWLNETGEHGGQFARNLRWVHVQLVVGRAEHRRHRPRPIDLRGHVVKTDRECLQVRRANRSGARHQSARIDAPRQEDADGNVRDQMSTHAFADGRPDIGAERVGRFVLPGAGRTRCTSANAPLLATSSRHRRQVPGPAFPPRRQVRGGGTFLFEKRENAGRGRRLGQAAARRGAKLRGKGDVTGRRDVERRSRTDRNTRSERSRASQHAKANMPRTSTGARAAARDKAEQHFGVAAAHKPLAARLKVSARSAR